MGSHTNAVHGGSYCVVCIQCSVILEVLGGDGVYLILFSFQMALVSNMSVCWVTVMCGSREKSSSVVLSRGRRSMNRVTYGW